MDIVNKDGTVYENGIVYDKLHTVYLKWCTVQVVAAMVDANRIHLLKLPSLMFNCYDQNDDLLPYI